MKAHHADTSKYISLKADPNSNSMYKSQVILYSTLSKPKTKKLKVRDTKAYFKGNPGFQKIRLAIMYTFRQKYGIMEEFLSV